MSSRKNLSGEEASLKRERIKAAYNSNGDWRQLASDLNVSKSTAYSWIKADSNREISQIMVVTVM